MICWPILTKSHKTFSVMSSPIRLLSILQDCFIKYKCNLNDVIKVQRVIVAVWVGCKCTVYLNRQTNPCAIQRMWSRSRHRSGDQHAITSKVKKKNNQEWDLGCTRVYVLLILCVSLQSGIGQVLVSYWSGIGQALV